jgi:RHS repeat-associated protein
MSMNGGAVTMIYDAFGNRVSKTVGNVTTKYLVEDDVNPTGLPQVFEESVDGVLQRTYTYGFQRISENQQIQGAWTPSFYGYDGFGSVRQLTDLNGIVTDNYNYDAFGNLLSSPGPTPNNYLYRGEQYDSDLGLYYLRARYYNPVTGRFLSRDPEDGKTLDPRSLHKYLYAAGDPVNLFDPTGRDEVEYRLTMIPGGSAPGPIAEMVGNAASRAATFAINQFLAAMSAASNATAVVAAYLAAVDWVSLAKGLTKVLLCGALEVGLDALIDKLTTEGVSDFLPSELTNKFEEACLAVQTW